MRKSQTTINPLLAAIPVVSGLLIVLPGCEYEPPGTRTAGDGGVAEIERSNAAAAAEHPEADMPPLPRKLEGEDFDAWLQAVAGAGGRGQGGARRSISPDDLTIDAEGRLAFKSDDANGAKPNDEMHRNLAAIGEQLDLISPEMREAARTAEDTTRELGEIMREMERLAHLAVQTQQTLLEARFLAGERRDAPDGDPTNAAEAPPEAAETEAAAAESSADEKPHEPVATDRGSKAGNAADE